MPQLTALIWRWRFHRSYGVQVTKGINKPGFAHVWLSACILHAVNQTSNVLLFWMSPDVLDDMGRQVETVDVEGWSNEIERR